MRSITVRYGLYSILAIVALSAVQFFLWMPNVSFGWAEFGGYLTMVLSMIFVFLGIRRYRDTVGKGYLTFGQGLKIGALISLLPSVAFGLFDILYTEVINPNWLNDYYTKYTEQLKLTIPAAELPAKLAELEKQKELFGNSFMQFLLMAATVFIIGIIVTIISSLALRRRPVKALV